MNPQSARSYFRFRTLINIAFVFGGFFVVVFIASLFQWGWIIKIIAGGVAYFIFFHILFNQTIMMTCPNCFELIATNTPWFCKSCKKPNYNTDAFPFIHRCEHCGVEPKAYICHHEKCKSKVIFFGGDKDARHAATSFTDPAPKPPSIQETRRENKENLIYQIETAELNEKLAVIQKRSDLANKKKKTPQEHIEADFENFYPKAMGYREYARKKLKEAEERYKDDLEGLQDAKDAINAWLREKTHNEPPF